MNMPFDPLAWRALERRAAAALSANFAENTLRASRLAVESATAHFRSSLIISAATAAICLVGLLFVHTRETRATTAQHLAAWQEISAQTVSFDPSP
jgi:hypothetical protein